MEKYDDIKKTGSHYTPPELAEFLADLALNAAGTRSDFSVLDPACGDGSLLAAISDMAGKRRASSMRLVGLDQSQTAVDETRARLSTYDELTFVVERVDFLEHVTDLLSSQVELFASAEADNGPEKFDLVIANPPYVRTQVLGATESRRLATVLGLSGRVDLYHAFVRAMTASLVPGGTLALLCSNRFLFTQAGASVRRMLSEDFELERVIDLGDTKLFGAAVLPAIVIATRASKPLNSSPSFTRVYEIRDGLESVAQEHPSVLQALGEKASGAIRVDGSSFSVENGVVDVKAGGKPWTLTTAESSKWLERIGRHTATTFGDISQIRVGIKTTADAVFVRSDWWEMEPEVRPEDELLHPLITHHVADRWQSSTPSAWALYPHEMVNGKKSPIDLREYPRAQKYLLTHRERLEGRNYVIEAGRKWYEIWVPQSPDDWQKPKLVCPDISESPRFSLDSTGALVQGDCYWITMKPDQDARWLLLMLAVANSSLAVKFYDTVCGNKLYAGRRRFITQYIKQFPLPDLDGPVSARIIDISSQLSTKPDSGDHKAELEAECNRLVEQSFGGIK